MNYTPDKLIAQNPDLAITPVTELLEKFLKVGYADLETYLAIFAPDRLIMFQEILAEVGFEFQYPVYVQFDLPMNVGGYYCFKEGEQHYGFNPLFLMTATKERLAHILTHEAAHSGLLTDGIEVQDEGTTDLLARKKLEEVYGIPARSLTDGYDELVEEIYPELGQLSFAQLVEKVNVDDMQTLANFVEALVILPALQSADLNDWRYENLTSVLQDKWPWVLNQFPRLANSIAGNGAGAHEAGQLDFQGAVQDAIVRKAAECLLRENKQKGTTSKMRMLVQNIFAVNPDADDEAILNILRNAGLYYVYDLYPSEVEQSVTDARDRQPNSVESKPSYIEA